MNQFHRLFQVFFDEQVYFFGMQMDKVFDKLVCL